MIQTTVPMKMFTGLFSHRHEIHAGLSLIGLLRKPYHRLHVDTKMRSHAIKDFFRKCDQTHSFLRIWSLEKTSFFVQCLDRIEV